MKFCHILIICIECFREHTVACISLRRFVLSVVAVCCAFPSLDFLDSCDMSLENNFFGTTYSELLTFIWLVAGAIALNKHLGSANLREEVPFYLSLCTS